MSDRSVRHQELDILYIDGIPVNGQVKLVVTENTITITRLAIIFSYMFVPGARVTVECGAFKGYAVFSTSLTETRSLGAALQVLMFDLEEGVKGDGQQFKSRAGKIQ